MEFYNIGTEVNLNLLNVKGYIVAIRVSLNAFKYEISYCSEGSSYTCYFYEFEFSVTGEDIKSEFGFK